MTGNILTIRVESNEAFFADALADIRRIEEDDEIDDAHVVSLPDEEALERVFNAKNLELLRTIAQKNPQSVREVARLVDRDVKNVSTALTELNELGVVKFEQTGRAKRPVVWYDEIEANYPLGLSEDDEMTAQQ